MATPVEIASDVIAGGSALAGLVLVYIGGVAASYASFPPANQPDVRCQYLVKIWFAFVGALLAIISVGLAIVAKWYGIEQLASISIVILLITLAWSVVILFLSAREVA
jgi:predicted lipid-binding transport protein (Tim44 family)